jgi:hypothetical protein
MNSWKAKIITSIGSEEGSISKSEEFGKWSIACRRFFGLALNTKD